MVTVRLDVGVFWASSAEETLSVYAEAVKAERVGVGCCCQMSDMVTNPNIGFYFAYKSKNRTLSKRQQHILLFHFLPLR